MNANTALANLGKATRRGVKKCPKCGIYNGTRGIICKNKRCDVVFKDSSNKDFRKVLDAVRLSGIVRQIYSVRVRDRGPDQRGFVQLPFCLHNNNEEATATAVTCSTSGTENALCFVESCQRLFDDSILKCHEEAEITTNNKQTSSVTDVNINKILKCTNKSKTSSSSLCAHIHAAIKSNNNNMASPMMEVNEDIVNALKVSKETKEGLWLLVSEKEGPPLVQRVSKNVLAVKCQVSPKHPLGYLHIVFGSSRGKEIYDKYQCCCTSQYISYNSTTMRAKCIHYYACICALVSTGSKYFEEFACFINHEFPLQNSNRMMNNNKIYADFPLLLLRSSSSSEKKCAKKLLPSASSKNKIKRQHRTIKHDRVTTSKKKFASHYDNNQFQLLTPKIALSFNNSNAGYCETSWSFSNWLTYVTESINQTMHFENYANLNNLLFFIPEHFFEEFERRIPHIYKEINSNFSNSISFHIMNILHLKEIFDTIQVKLRISKRFIHDNQKGYVEFIENEETTTCQSSFIFFLNVGQTTVDENDNTNNSFLIEWIPNFSHITKIGQLKLQYKYGRKST